MPNPKSLKELSKLWTSATKAQMEEWVTVMGKTPIQVAAVEEKYSPGATTPTISITRTKEIEEVIERRQNELSPPANAQLAAVQKRISQERDQMLWEQLGRARQNFPQPRRGRVFDEVYSAPRPEERARRLYASLEELKKFVVELRGAQANRLLRLVEAVETNIGQENLAGLGQTAAEKQGGLYTCWVVVRKETEKAILVAVEGRSDEMWFPRSQCTVINRLNSVQMQIEIPLWLAMLNGLVAYSSDAFVEQEERENLSGSWGRDIAYDPAQSPKRKPKKKTTTKQEEPKRWIEL